MKFKLSVKACTSVTVNRKPIFDKAANWTNRTTNTANNTADIISGFMFFRVNNAANSLHLSACKSGKVAGNIHISDEITEHFKAANAFYIERALCLITQDFYDSYAHGAENGKYSRYDVFATACVAWLHDLGFNATANDVSRIAMSIGYNVSSNTALLKTHEALTPAKPRTFALKVINALADIIGPTCKRYDFETLCARANIKIKK